MPRIALSDLLQHPLLTECDVFIVKLDVEGSEVAALEGLPADLFQKIQYIAVEVGVVESTHAW